MTSPVSVVESVWRCDENNIIYLPCKTHKLKLLLSKIDINKSAKLDENAANQQSVYIDGRDLGLKVTLVDIYMTSIKVEMFSVIYFKII